MNESNHEIAVLCAIGIMLLMIALGSAIFLGTSQLVASEHTFVQASNLMTAALFIVGFSLLGGYLVSYGFITTFRGQKKEENVQLE